MAGANHKSKQGSPPIPKAIEAVPVAQASTGRASKLVDISAAAKGRTSLKVQVTKSVLGDFIGQPGANTGSHKDFDVSTRRSRSRAIVDGAMSAVREARASTGKAPSQVRFSVPVVRGRTAYTHEFSARKVGDKMVVGLSRVRVGGGTGFITDRPSKVVAKEKAFKAALVKRHADAASAASAAAAAPKPVPVAPPRKATRITVGRMDGAPILTTNFKARGKEFRASISGPGQASAYHARGGVAPKYAQKRAERISRAIHSRYDKTGTVPGLKLPRSA